MLKIGVIGLGSISQHHLKAYQQHEDAEIIALCDGNKSRLQEVGRMYGVPYHYETVAELLTNPEVDAVSICTWNHSHAEIAIAALEAGKHVLVEKPLAIHTEEALAVEEAVKRTGKILQVGFVRRHSDHAKILKGMIDRGTLGEIYYSKATLLRRLGNPGGWFSKKELSGGGPLIDLGVHMIDICWYLMGKPEPVLVSGNTYSRVGNRHEVKHLSFYKAADYDSSLNNVEDMANTLIRFDNGASLFVDVSFTMHVKQNELSVQLFGDQGGAELEPRLTLVTENEGTILNTEPQIDYPSFQMQNSFSNQIHHFIRTCQGLDENIAPVEDGVRIAKLIEAIYTAAEGKEVYV
jgi:predicted dehydrogenase